jgi:hypothetical protein
MWLLGRLAPDHKTIADFHKDNGRFQSHLVLQRGNRQFPNSTSSDHLACSNLIRKIASIAAVCLIFLALSSTAALALLGSTTTVVSSTNPSTFGQSVTFTATVTGLIVPPTGTVTFKDGATTLGTGSLNGSGQATFSTGALSAGGHSITAVYGGDLLYNPSTSSVLTQTVNQASSTTSVSSSVNPSAVDQSVTFTTTVTAPGGTPTGTVTFRDGATTLGAATLSGGTATLSLSTLAAGSHSITAVYGGSIQFTPSTSALLLQAVVVPADSLKLRAMQIMATKLVAENSGSAIEGTIDAAISEGFNGGDKLIAPGGGGIRFNFSGDSDQPQAAATGSTVSDRWNGLYGPNPSGGFDSNEQGPQTSSRISDAFAAIDRNTNYTKVPSARYVEPKDWLLWADVRGAVVDRWSSSAPPVLYGNQINALMGLTHKLTPTFLVGVLGGYEIFDYRDDALVGHLKGNGWTVGSYLGWKFAPGLRFDAAAAYSGIGYDSAAGVASGSFSAHRWLAASGLTGTYKAYGLEIEPSAKVYALWEQENAYVDSLGTDQTDRRFFTGRASSGVKLSNPWFYSAKVTITPYVGFYADYYFTGDSAASEDLVGAPQFASVPFLQGWSGRATGGLGARFANGATVLIGAELGGFGSNMEIWTFRGRASVPF